MMTITAQIKHAPDNLNYLDQLGTKINLQDILSDEFKQELSSDINNGY